MFFYCVINIVSKGVSYDYCDNDDGCYDTQTTQQRGVLDHRTL